MSFLPSPGTLFAKFDPSILPFDVDILAFECEAVHSTNTGIEARPLINLLIRPTHAACSAAGVRENVLPRKQALRLHSSSLSCVLTGLIELDTLLCMQAFYR
jgi:hypothetical protein